MAIDKALPARGDTRPRSNGGGRRSGQGAGSALHEMLRRQAQNPRPGSGQATPAGKDRPQNEPRPQQPPRRNGP